MKATSPKDRGDRAVGERRRRSPLGLRSWRDPPAAEEHLLVAKYGRKGCRGVSRTSKSVKKELCKHALVRTKGWVLVVVIYSNRRRPDHAGVRVVQVAKILICTLT